MFFSVQDGVACWDSGYPRMHHANVEKTAIRCLYGKSLLKNYATTVNVVYNSELLLNQQYGKLLSN